MQKKKDKPSNTRVDSARIANRKRPRRVISSNKANDSPIEEARQLKTPATVDAHAAGSASSAKPGTVRLAAHKATQGVSAPAKTKTKTKSKSNANTGSIASSRTPRTAAQKRDPHAYSVDAFKKGGLRAKDFEEENDSQLETGGECARALSHVTFLHCIAEEKEAGAVGAQEDEDHSNGSGVERAGCHRSLVHGSN